MSRSRIPFFIGCALLLLSGPLTTLEGGERFPWNAADDRFADRPAHPQRWFYRWDHEFSSTEGRPVPTMHIGQGAFRTVVVGSVHGSEAMAVAVVEELARHLGNRPDQWDSFNALLIRTANPDGLARESSLNSRGVDLNRNFPAADFRADETIRSGPRAASEVETRAVCRLIDEHRPQRVIHIKATRNRTGWALCNRRARGVAGQLARFPNLRVGALEQHLLAGSLESYVSGRLDLEMVTIAVPHAPDVETVWDEYRNPVAAAVAFVDPGSRPPAGNVWNGGIAGPLRPAIRPRENGRRIPLENPFETRGRISSSARMLPEPERLPWLRSSLVP